MEKTMQNFAFFGVLGIIMIVSFMIYAIVMLIASKKHTTHLAATMALALLAAPVLTLLNALPTFAYDEEACMEYDEGIVCFGLDISGDDYEFDIRVGDYEGNGSPSLYCEIRHTSSSTALWEECDDEIRWTGNNGEFIISATLDGESGTARFDIDDEDWDLEFDEVDPDDVDDFSGNNSSSGTSNSDDVDDIDVKTDDDEYREDEYIDVTVKLLDDDGDVATRAEGQVNFEVEERRNGSWQNASSSDYDLDMDDYDFDEDDDGEKTFNNLLKIEDEGEFRIVVEWDDDDDITDSDSFDVDNDNNSSSSNSDDVDDISVSSPSSQHEEDEYIDVTVKLLDDDGDVATRAEGQVNFEVQEHKSNGWFSASSSDYTLAMDDYNFDEDDDGERTFNNLVKIRNEGEFRLRVEWDDDDDIYDNEVFDIGDNAGDDDNAIGFDVDTDDDNPDEDEYIDLIIEAERSGGVRADDYTNTIEFNVFYLNQSSWQKTTSSAYFTLKRDDYRFTSSDNGKVTLDNWIRFNREEKYRVEIYDEDDSSIDGDVIIEVGDGSDSGDGEPSYIEVEVDDETPGLNDYLDLTVTIRDHNDDIVDDFNEDVDVKIYYRDGNGWQRTTSSSEFTIDSNEIDFSNSDDGEKKLNNFIKFRKEREYRIEVEWPEDISVDGDIEVDVGGSSNDDDDLDRIKLTPEDTTPQEDRWLDLDIEMIAEDGSTYEDFDDEVIFKVYWKDGSVWRQTTNPSFYEINDDYEDGYDFRSSEDGEKSFNNFIRFKQSEEFRLEVEVEDRRTVDGDAYFRVGDADDSDSVTTDDPDLFAVEVLTKDPNKSDRVDFEIKAITEDGDVSENYDERIIFVTQELSTSASTSWKTPSNGDTTTYLNSYKFTLSDDGKKNLYDVWSAQRDGYYRVTVRQDNDSDQFGWAYLFITDNIQYASSMPGFSSTERTKVRAYYKAWPQVVNAILYSYPELVGDEDWEELWLRFYNRMEDTVRGVSGRYTSYNSFEDGLIDFVEDTVNDYIND